MKKSYLLAKYQNEKQQSLQSQELEWLANKSKMFNEEKQKAILASASTFAEHDIIIKSTVPPHQH